VSTWLDYSFSRPNLAQVKRDGAAGVIRYICPDTPNTHGKLLTAGERDQILAAGLDLTLNFEWYEGRCNEGGSAGASDGATALTTAKALGYPQGKTIYYSHDTGAYNWPAIDAYFRSVRAAHGGYYKVGAYGSYDLVTHLHAAGLIDKGWQTLAWSGGRRDPWAVIYQNGQQRYGGAADVNEVTSTDIGSWLDGPPADWFDMATKAELYAVVDERLNFYLPRVLDSLRFGTANTAFTAAELGRLADGRGLDGDIKDARADVGAVARAEVTLLAQVTALQSQNEALKQQLVALGQPVVDVSAITPQIVQAAHDGAASALTGATISGTISKGA
jgi:hypothetical protein